ncbi:MAG: hypothetical protein M3Z17_05970 [Gemmatimonadota bacterium]|nr:hypothetical protein [Gemmatimonadota bacterium]
MHSCRSHSFRLLTVLGLAVIASSWFAPGARAQIAVLGNTVEERAATPGETYIGTIVVKNLTAVAQAVRIYQTDYSFFSDGTSHFDAPGSLKRSNASWITPATGSIALPPSGAITVAYTVRVPMSDTLHGTYWSTIMVEGAENSPPVTAAKKVGLGSIMRYAVQVATHLDTGEIGKIAFDKQRVVADSTGTEFLELEVLNTGEKGYRPLMWMELYDSMGSLRTKVQQQRGLLYPATSVIQKFALGKLAAGSYKAVVFADTGDDAVFAAEFKLKF